MRKFESALECIKRGEFQTAEKLLLQITATEPQNFDANHMLGIVCGKLNKLEQADKFFKTSLSIDASFPPLYHNYGLFLSKIKQFDKAIEQFDIALRLFPNFAPVYSDRGNALEKLHKYDDAFAAYDKALSLKPDLAEAWLGRGNVFMNLKRYDDAFAAYDKAFSIKPDLEGAEGARLHSKMHSCNWTQFKTELSRLTNNVKASKLNTDPFVLLALSDSPGDHLRCARIWASKNYPLQHPRMWRSQIYNHDKIRVAYVSSDFREHPVARLIAQTIELHDRTKFDVIALSLGPDDSSIMRQRVIKSVDKFVDCRKLGDSEIAQMIAGAEVDVLVDLMGFTWDARTDIFAFRAAPIQVNYLGYPGTMGAGYFDYIIGDKAIFTELDEQFYSEKLIRLPYSYQPNDKRAISDKAFERRDFGLPKDSFVFSCFNNNYKILPDVFDCWMRILKRVDNSVLWLSWGSADSTASNLRNEAAKRQVDPERLIFAKRLPLSEEHLARLRLADLFLDTSPYNAHATASDALWAGLPVLTQMGQSFAGRVAASLLRAIGLPELIAYTSEDYEALAIELALNRNKFLNIKEKLNKSRLTTPLFDTALFTKHLEAAYNAMYRRYQAGLPPDHIDIVGIDGTISKIHHGIQCDGRKKWDGLNH